MVVEKKSKISSYSPPWFLFNAHLETIYPSVFRKVKLNGYKREQIKTNDDDFLDIDWLKQGSEKLVVISHGLEGNSHRPYIKGMAKAFFNKGFDVLAWNFRGCGEEMNKTLRFYHSGATDDLLTVINHAIAQDYNELFLIGFSLGGNLTLKFLGEGNVSEKIKRAVTFSVPMELNTSGEKISKPSNWIYSNRFIKSLKQKVKAKSLFKKEIDITGLDSIKTLREFDDRYTAPLHGFKNALDYYDKCSALHFLKNIKIPTLVVNAKNDPFLSDECFPQDIKNEFVNFEFPERGGHVGFAAFNGKNLYWSEQRALDFILPI